MPNFSKEQYAAYMARQSAQNRAQGLPAPEPEHNPGMPLEPTPQREAASPSRYHVRFDVYACRPRDWDNNFCKPLQDCLVEAGFLPDDNWQILSGSMQCHKVKTKDQERTEITLTKL